MFAVKSFLPQRALRKIRKEHKGFDNKHYYIDLVFYHRILKCFVLIDLKINEVEHYDIGQMNMYLNYFKTELNVAGDKAPVGILMTAEKEDVMVEYAIGVLPIKYLFQNISYIFLTRSN